MRVFLFLFVVFFQFHAFGQQHDSITFNVDSAHQSVSHERQLLLDKFWAGRLDLLLPLVDSLDNKSAERPFLWDAERLLLYYWIERYDAIDSFVAHFSESCNECEINNPREQTVWNLLLYQSWENIDTLVKWIDQTGCDDDVFDFRLRLLHTLMDSDLDNQPDFESKMLSFKEQYYSMIKENIPEIPEIPEKQTDKPKSFSNPADDQWLIRFAIGMGPAYTSGNITNYFNTKSCLLIDFNVNYNRWYVSLASNIIFAKLKCDISAGATVWEKGENANLGSYGLSIGYSLFDNRFLRMTPFIGLSASDCTPTEQQIENNPDLRDAVVRWGFANIYGTNMDFKLYNIINVLEKKDLPVSINIRLNYVQGMFNKVKGSFSGNMLLFTMGISMELQSSSW